MCKTASGCLNWVSWLPYQESRTNASAKKGNESRPPPQATHHPCSLMPHNMLNKFAWSKCPDNRHDVVCIQVSEHNCIAILKNHLAKAKQPLQKPRRGDAANSKTPLLCMLLGLASMISCASKYADKKIGANKAVLPFTSTMSKRPGTAPAGTAPATTLCPKRPRSSKDTRTCTDSKPHRHPVPKRPYSLRHPKHHSHKRQLHRHLVSKAHTAG